MEAAYLPKTSVSSGNSLREFAERLRFAIREKNLSQKEFAEGIGISQGFLSHVLRAEKGISRQMLRAIQYAWLISADWLETGVGHWAIPRGGRENMSDLDAQTWMSEKGLYRADDPEGPDYEFPEPPEWYTGEDHDPETMSRHKAAGVGARFKSIRERLRLSQSEFAKRLGIDQATLSRYEKGYRSPTVDAIVSAQREFGVRVEFIVSGREPMLDTDEPSDGAGFLRPVQVRFVRPSGKWFSETGVDETAYIPLPIVSGSVAAGSPRAISEHDVDDWVPAIYHPEWNPHPEKTVCVRVKGDSMEPTIPDGGLVAIDWAQRDPRALTRHIAAFRVDGGVTVKRLFVTDKGLWIARPDNPNSTDLFHFEDDEIADAVVGKVVWWWAKP